MEVPGLACHQPKLLPKVGRYELLLSCDLDAVRESDLVFSFIALRGTGASATKSSVYHGADIYHSGDHNIT